MGQGGVAGGVHRHAHRVRFGDCDPAGIVYFPRFFDLFHQAMETWFSAIGAPYAPLITGRKIGFPAVHTEADFRRPCALGEALFVELRVGTLGSSSLGLRYAVTGADDPAHDPPRVTGSTVCVVMDLDPQSQGYRRSMPVPADLRAAIETFGVSG